MTAPRVLIGVDTDVAVVMRVVEVVGVVRAVNFIVVVVLASALRSSIF